LEKKGRKKMPYPLKEEMRRKTLGEVFRDRSKRREKRRVNFMFAFRKREKRDLKKKKERESLGRKEVRENPWVTGASGSEEKKSTI